MKMGAILEIIITLIDLLLNFFTKIFNIIIGRATLTRATDIYSGPAHSLTLFE